MSYSIWYYMLNNKLVKKRKPCLPAEYVHLHSRNGCYRVYHVNLLFFYIMINNKIVERRWDDFRCKEGEGNSPEKYEKLRTRQQLKDLDSNIKEMLAKYKELRKGR